MTRCRPRWPGSHLVRRWLSSMLVCAVVPTIAWAAAPQRVVAVGDVHGSLEGLVEILQETGMIDATRHWTGGDAVLVQCGDLLDRGLMVREVLDLMMRLQSAAPAAGGRVVVLLGNHEAMNVLGNTRDVNPDVYARFADRHSEKRRDAAYSRYSEHMGRWARQPGRDEKQSSGDGEVQWKHACPAGRLEYLEAMGPEGAYGRWLRRLPVTVRIGDTLFVHGGIGPRLKGLDVAEINARAAREIEAFDRGRAELVARGLVLPTASVDSAGPAARALTTGGGSGGVAGDPSPCLATLAQWKSWFIVNRDGPLWFRGAAVWDERTKAEEMTTILDGLGVERMVVGHTVQDNHRVHTRFGGRVVVIDTGMLSSHYKGGRPSAVELVDGGVFAVYRDRRDTLVTRPRSHGRPPPPVEAGAPPPPAG